MWLLEVMVGVLVAVVPHHKVSGGLLGAGEGAGEGAG